VRLEPQGTAGCCVQQHASPVTAAAGIAAAAAAAAAPLLLLLLLQPPLLLLLLLLLQLAVGPTPRHTLRSPSSGPCTCRNHAEAPQDARCTGGGMLHGPAQGPEPQAPVLCPAARGIALRQAMLPRCKLVLACRKPSRCAASSAAVRRGTLPAASCLACGASCTGAASEGGGATSLMGTGT
jgi:hypothetical protein